MMKKYLIITFILILSFQLYGCGSENKKAVQQAGTGHSNVKFVDNTPADSKSDTTDADDGNIREPDINISAGDTNVIYSKANEIAAKYTSYLGKTIRIKGSYKVEKAPSRYYYYCLVSDPTACCNSGFEFILKDKTNYPKNDGEVFTVQGTLHSYKEGDNTFLELIDAVIVK